MRKLFCLAVLAAALALCGCAANLPEGYDQIKNARKLYDALDSGKLVIEDISDGERLAEFSFYINKNDEMVLRYDGFQRGEYAYSNGAEFFYKTDGADGWSVIAPEDEGYIYNVYNREYRYPYADGNMFFLDGTSVSEATLDYGGDGSLSVTYVYDPEKLNSYAAERLDNVESFTSLTAVYTIDAQGYITEFTECGTVVDAQGVSSDVDLKFTVSDMNNVYDIPNPVDYLAESG